MKILQIFPGKVWGGAEQYVLDLGRSLQSRGHEVRYMCRDADAVTSRLDNDVSYSIFAMATLRSHLQWCDVVHIHDASFLRPVMKSIDRTGSAAKVVLTRHIARDSRVWWPMRRYYSRLHRMIFVSRLGCDLWSGVNPWMPKDKMVVIHNSIADHPAAREGVPSLRKDIGIADDVPLIMFTGRVRKSKGCGVLVDALGQLRNLPWHLVMIGNCKPAGYKATLLKLAEKHSIAHRITFTGFTPHVYGLIEQADVGVAPSIVREACPLSPMEFMKMGKCVITTDNGAQPEYVQGLMVRPDDSEALATALYSAITDAELRNKLGRDAARYFAENMSYSDFVDRIFRAYS